MDAFKLVLLWVGCVLAVDVDLEEPWETYKDTYDKEYENETHEEAKQEHWEKKVQAIIQHNLEASFGEHSYTKGINRFTDMTDEELDRHSGGTVDNETVLEYYPESLTSNRGGNPPSYFDWRDQGYVGELRNQKKCGSCWAFAAAAALEAAWYQRTGKKRSFSEQQLVDCSRNFGTKGCSEGSPVGAFKYVKKYGIEDYSCYPYENDEDRCREDDDCMVTKIDNFYGVPKNENDLLKAVYNHGPVVVVIYASRSFHEYEGGIFYDKNCNNRNTNHVVVVIGWGSDGDEDYWIIKNSWGTDWGEDGYMRMARNNNNMCMIVNYAVFPDLG